MALDILSLLKPEEVVEFASQINVADQGTDGDMLFPNQKTQYLEAEYMRLTQSPSLPHCASVHAFDTEALIGKRKTAELVTIEQLLIKEKINQSESVRRVLRAGVPENAQDIISYIYDDVGNLVQAVRTRAEVAKFEALCTGKMLISENGVSLEVDYGVPDENKVNFDWHDPGYDILTDIRKLVNAGKRKGQRYNRAMTSQTVMDMILANVGIQNAINGTYMTGVMITQEGVNNLFQKLFGFTITVNDDWYQYTTATGADTTARYFEEYKFVMYVGSNTGAVGTGLWGVTPEENEADAFNAGTASYNNLIYVSRWKTQDPVAVWTKASGVFIPVMPNPLGICIVNVGGTSTLREIDVETTASSETTNGSVVSIDTTECGVGNTYAYKVGSSYEDVAYNDTITVGSGNWTAITNGDTITATTKANKLTVVEITSANKAVGVGHCVVNKK